jgi:ADP-ribosylglycohydrolase
MKKKIYIAFLIISISAQLASFSQTKSNQDFIRNKIKGLLTGSLIGDALGGPIEFQGHAEIQASPNPPKLWTDTTDLMDAQEIQAAKDRMYFREYKYVLPHVQPYGCWSENAAPGTVTDDSRHKIILMYFLRHALKENQWPVNQKNLAQAYLDWSQSSTIAKHPGYDTLCRQWLDESYKAIRWLMGSREIGYAYPLERLWNAYPTCYGQMALTPLAAMYPGEPEKAYLSAYDLAYFDNGFAKDMIGASVAGLSVALTLDPSKFTNEQLWQKVLEAIKTTDPYDYLKVPWCWRAVDRWMYVVDDFVKKANGSPAKLFALFENEFMYNAKWEAQIPFVVSFACLKICNYDPLAAMQLSIEWGYDHDSYPQFLGAFVGALYGPDIFKAAMSETVIKRMQLDYDEDVNEWVTILMKTQQIGTRKKLVSN